MPSEARFGVQTALRLKSQKPKATGIHREKQQSFHRHSHESGNLDPSARKPIFRHSTNPTPPLPVQIRTKIHIPSFPRKWESRT
ncbi:hypothetical protein EYK70_01570 [Neisseria gonorrhoeae]|uniref:hypothetical protein n=1 Tax=Neisseria gonorrhoeae TaxID=485 RepID=UPI000A5E0CC1|nr:hypothetical protein [Neisseria gonorrhoeae]